jgi:hypothetical protein
MEQEKTPGEGRDIASFYGSDSMSEARKLALSGAAESEDTEALLANMRVRIVDTLNKHPGDARLLLDGIDTLSRIAAATGRPSGGSQKSLAERMAAVLNSFGDQWLPNEAGEPRTGEPRTGEASEDVGLRIAGCSAETEAAPDGGPLTPDT